MGFRAVAAEQWPVPEWLWQAYYHDLSSFRDAYPRADGRFNHAWHMRAFFVVRAVRRTGTARGLALWTVRHHPGPWEIAFQEENPRAARFWRGLADEAFPGGWREETRPVPGRPDLPQDVFILAD